MEPGFEFCESGSMPHRMMSPPPSMIPTLTARTRALIFAFLAVALPARADLAAELKALNATRKAGQSAPAPDTDFGDRQRKLLEQAVQADPIAAAETVLKQPELVMAGDFYLINVQAVFRQWGKADLPAMERWVGAHPLHGELQPCADYALFQHRLKGLTEEQSIALWRKLPAFTKGWAQRDIAGIVASSDPATALDRISRIFPAGQRSVMMGCALDIVVRKHPGALLPWLEELAPVFYNEPAASAALFQLPAEDVSAALAKLTPKARGEISLEFMRHCLSQEDYARAKKLIAGVTEEPYKSMMDSELRSSLKGAGIE
jgi:hypothetical protein